MLARGGSSPARAYGAPVVETSKAIVTSRRCADVANAPLPANVSHLGSGELLRHLEAPLAYHQPHQLLGQSTAQEQAHGGIHGVAEDLLRKLVFVRPAAPAHMMLHVPRKFEQVPRGKREEWKVKRQYLERQPGPLLASGEAREKARHVARATGLVKDALDHIVAQGEPRVVGCCCLTPRLVGS
eukprot:4393469-Prymnesium_polylepis.1